MIRRTIQWIIVLSIIAAISLLIWRTVRPKPVLVVVKQVTRGTVARTVANTRAGTVKACRRAKLSPSVGGQISQLPIKEGDSVKKGDLLLALWNEDLKAQAQLAQREVEAARNRASAACFKAGSARRSADRLVQLRQKDVVPEDTTENAVAEATALEAECRARKTEVRVLAAKVALSKANLERTRLVAPFNGVIAEINGELFEFVTPSPIGIPTPPAVDIIESDCFYVVAPIDEVDAAGIAVDMDVTITLDAFKDRRFQGRVRRIADYVSDIEKQARTVDVEVRFVHPEDIDHLLAGYSADIEVILDVRKEVVRVPTEAVIEGQRVFVFDSESGRLSERVFKKGLSNWDWTEVADGLMPQMLVVVNVDAPDIEDDAQAVLMEEEK